MTLYLLTKEPFHDNSTPLGVFPTKEAAEIAMVDPAMIANLDDVDDLYCLWEVLEDSSDPAVPYPPLRLVSWYDQTGVPVTTRPVTPIED